MKDSTSAPYNIREKQEKNAAYRSLIRAELADELYDRILNIVIIEKRYRNKDFSAKELAVELGTNTRYISAVINSRFNTNFSCLINEYRIKEAQHKLTDKRFQRMTIEEIGKQDWMLTPGRYVGIAEKEQDTEPFEEKMSRLTTELSSLFEQSHTLEVEIKKQLESIGYKL